MSEPNKTFVFVSQFSDGKPIDGKGIRQQIRKQAMRNVALERKRRGGYGQRNVGQYPIFVSRGDPILFDPESTTDDEVDIATFHVRICEASYRWHTLMPAKMPPSLFDKLRSDLDFDVRLLSHLTSVLFGRIAARNLSAQPDLIAHILVGSRWSYLNFLPIRCEENQLLRDVCFCVTARCRQLLRNQSATSEPAILRAYCIALQRLQSAITDANQCLEPDVLCAVELLGVFEILKFSRANQWEHHIIGASRIIRNRGPTRFHSEYERALFVSQVGAIVIECILNNEDCFLDEREWKSILESMVLDDVPPFADRSKISIDLWCMVLQLPQLWRQITDLICHRSEPDPGLAIELTLRAFKLRTGFSNWLHQAQASLTALPPGRVWESQSAEVIGGCYALLMATSRLIVSLAPRTSLKYEREVQKWAQDTHDESINSGSRCFFLAQRFAIASAALQTHEEWEKACTSLDDSVLSSNSTLTKGLERVGECKTPCASASSTVEGNKIEDHSLKRPQSKTECKDLDSSTGACTEGRESAAIERPVHIHISEEARQASLPTERWEDRRIVISKTAFERWCNILGRKTT